MHTVKIAIIGDEKAFRRNENYYHAVTACGAEAVALSLYDGLPGLKEADGLIIPGGCDADPELYHETNTASRDIDRALDSFELSAIREAVSAGKPILGICRGLQLINVFFGGSLLQDIPDKERHIWIDENTDNLHAVTLACGSFLSAIYEQDRITVNSAHHQAIHVLGEGLCEAASCDDRVIEAISHKNLPVYGVQWHPERMCLKYVRPEAANGLLIFKWFVQFLSLFPQAMSRADNLMYGNKSELKKKRP